MKAEDRLVAAIVDAIVEEVDPERVILFGSRARGEEGEKSDVDLVVIEAEPFGESRSRHAEMVRIDVTLAKFRVPADVLVYSEDEVEYWRDSINHVLARALREGRALGAGARDAGSRSCSGRWPNRVAHGARTVATGLSPVGPGYHEIRTGY